MTVWMYGETDNRWTLSPIEAAIQKGTSWVVKPFAILILFSEVAKALNLKQQIGQKWDYGKNEHGNYQINGQTHRLGTNKVL